MNLEILRKIGLTDSEISVYMTLIKKGTLTTGPIIKNSKISAGKVYNVLDRLIKKGLVSYDVKNEVKHYTASPPSKIKDYIKSKEDEIKKIEDDFYSFLPDLQSIYESERPKLSTQTYEGLEGIKTAIYDSLKGDEWRGMNVTSMKDKKQNLMWEAWQKERIRRGIPCRLISTNENVDFFKMFENLQVRVLKGLNLASIAVIGVRILIFDWKNEYVVVLENENMANSFKHFFESLWKISEKR